MRFTEKCVASIRLQAQAGPAPQPDRTPPNESLAETELRLTIDRTLELALELAEDVQAVYQPLTSRPGAATTKPSSRSSTS